MDTTGRRIRSLRRAQKLTQSELGEKAGVSATAIMRYEKDAREPKVQTFRAIANALGVSEGYLLCQTDNPYDYDILNPKRASIFRERASEIIEQADSSDLIEMFGTTHPYRNELNGIALLTNNKAREIAEALGVSFNYLIGTTDDPNDYSLPKSELLLALENKSEKLRAEILREKGNIENEAPNKIKAAQNELLKTVMEICKDPAPLDEAQRLRELEIMPTRIIHVRDFLLLKGNWDFLRKNMPGFVPTDEDM